MSIWPGAGTPPAPVTETHMGDGWVVSYRSTSGCNPLGLSRQPTAHNPVACVPPTAVSELSAAEVPSSGLAAGVHVAPEACSISVRRVPSAAVWNPTAQALPSARVSTPVNTASLGNIAGEFSDHRFPSQRNASG